MITNLRVDLRFKLHWCHSSHWSQLLTTSVPKHKWNRVHESGAAAVAVVVVAFVGDCMSHFPFNQQQITGPAAAGDDAGNPAAALWRDNSNICSARTVTTEVCPDTAASQTTSVHVDTDSFGE